MHDNFNFKGVKSCKRVRSQTVKIKLKNKFHMYSDTNNFFFFITAFTLFFNWKHIPVLVTVKISAEIINTYTYSGNLGQKGL